MAFKLAHFDDVLEGAGIVVPGPKGQEIASFKVGRGIFALDNSCPHREGPLGEGELDGSIVTCPWHDWQLDIDSGACQNMPGLDATSLDVHVVKRKIFLKEAP